MNIRDYIPKDKVDTRAVARAAALGFPALNPILPDLLAWMQDLNWPVSRDLAPLLATAGVEIAPSLKSVFVGDNLRRFAECPTPEQKLYGLYEIALETLLAHRI